MKTLKISDQTHVKLTKIVGQLTAETGKIATYEDAINALLHQSIVLPQSLLTSIQEFIEKNKQIGYTTEGFLKDAIKFRIEAQHSECKIRFPDPNTEASV
jgi:hypothetical protein